MRSASAGSQAVHLLQEVHPVGDGAPRIGPRVGVASGGPKRPEDVALLTAPIVNLLARTSSRSAQWCGHGLSHDQALPVPALGRFWSHLVKTHDAVLRRRDIEGCYRPLF